jgi:SPP1 gp7 family putative phage head morphogenesis protein
MTSPLELSYWDSEGDELWGFIGELMTINLLDGEYGGISAMPASLSTLVDYNYLNQAALDWARSYRYKLIRGITDTTRRQVQQAITQWMESGAPLSQLEAMLEPIFGSVRAGMIATTEVTRAFAEGNKMAWESTGVVDSMKWCTGEDDLVCPVCSELDGKVVSMGEMFAPDIDIPPAHVNCRCWIQPVVSEEKLANKLDNILGLYEAIPNLHRLAAINEAIKRNYLVVKEEA